MSKRTIITGGTGLIGRRLAAELVAAGHEVIVLSRDPSAHKPVPGARAVAWDARTATGWGHVADGAFAIINLAGESISGNRTLPLRGTWSAERKQRIKESRLRAGQAVVAAVAAAEVKPKVVIQMSGIDYYPSSDELMTEESPRGPQFTADVVADYWEPPTEGVEAMGVRRVVTRMAPLIHRETGPLPASLLQFNLFAGGRLGSGRQWMSWIHLDDTVRALTFLADCDEASGVYNLAAPHPVTNAEYTDILGRLLRRPTLLPVPAFALKLALGEVSSMVLDGRPVGVARLQALGFTFRFPTLEAALRDVLKK